MTARKYDVVYIVRPGDANEELRYSLRSLANLPHRKVWIVGHTPNWVTGVESIPGNVFDAKRRGQWNVVDNLRLAALHVDADRFVVMNDDIFLMTHPDLSPLYRTSLSRHIGASIGWWRDTLEVTYAYLVSLGIDEPLSYELHRPVLMERDKLLEITRLALGWQTKYPPQWRTLYGNLYKVGGASAVDGKVNRLGTKRPDLTALDVLSTQESTFRSHEAGKHIRATFTDPSPYEDPTVVGLRHRHRRVAYARRPSQVDRIAV